MLISSALGKLGKLLKFLGVAATAGSGVGFGPQKNEPPKVVKVESNLRTQERQERTYHTSFELNKNDLELFKKSINIEIGNDYVLEYRKKTDPGQGLEEAFFKQLIEELEAKKNAYEKVLSDDEIESLTSNTEQIILAKEVPNSGELGKFGPGSKGKGRARGDSPYSTSKSSTGKGTLFAHAFPVERNWPNRPPHRYRSTPEPESPTAKNAPRKKLSKGGNLSEKQA